MSSKYRKGGNKIRQSISFNTNRPQVLEFISQISSEPHRLKEYHINGQFKMILDTSNRLSQDQIILIVSAINNFKLISNEFEIVREIFFTILNSDFIPDSLEPIVKKYVQDINFTEGMETLVHFLITCLELCPGGSLRKMTLLIPSVIYSTRQSSSSDLSVLIEKLIAAFEGTKTKTEIENSKLALPPKAKTKIRSLYNNLSEFPKLSDIFLTSEGDSMETDASSNIKGDGEVNYESADHYLEVQFCLWKDEFVNHVKHSIIYVKNKLLIEGSKILTKKTNYVYENVFVESLCPSKNDLSFMVSVDVLKEDKSIYQDGTNRFQYGSLLCFTKNNFENVFFAFVAHNEVDILSQGILLVKFTEDPTSDIIEGNGYLMVDMDIRSDHYTQALERLKTLTKESLPFVDSFVFGKHTLKCPSFLQQEDLDSISDLVGVDLDSYEREALVYGLSNDISLIRGLRDEGKNKVCMNIIAYTMDHTLNKNKNMSPILVLYYTNRGLEQFVTEASQKIGADNIVMVGGIQNSDIAIKCGIFHVKKKWISSKKITYYFYKRFKENVNKQNSSEECLTRMNAEILHCHKRIISFDNLSPLMTDQHRAYFLKNDFYSWLLNTEAVAADYPILTHDLMGEVTEEVIIDLLYNDIDLLVKEGPTEDIITQKAAMTSDTFKHAAHLKMIKNMLSSLDSVTRSEYEGAMSLDVDFITRLRLYKYWMERYRGRLLEEYEIKKVEYDILLKEKEKIIFDEYVLIMKSMRVVAMTTSLAIKYASVLDQVGCQIVIIQEASKVDECHVVGSLSKGCQQLIMIGDEPLKEKKTIESESFIGRVARVSFFDQLVEKGFPSLSLKYLCDANLPCGHSCPLPRHPKSPSHQDYQCQLPCTKMCARNIHQCNLRCHEECRCDEETSIILLCGHSKIISCSEDEVKVNCNEICNKVLHCGHKCEGFCGHNCQCQQKVKKILECGHEFECLCWESIADLKCVKLCGKRLSCGHLCRRKCDHTCTCEEHVKFVLPCYHDKWLICGSDPSVTLCTFEVQRQFDCGHIASYKCFESKEKCNVEVRKELPCKHSITVMCNEVSKEAVCTWKCNVKLSCQHRCQGLCGDCCQGCLHVKCKKRCQKYLKCGHFCKYLCHSGTCPPCTQPCVRFCEHSKCLKECGTICDCGPCQLSCKEIINCSLCKKTERCPLLCGETCPNSCKGCSNKTGRDYRTNYIMKSCECFILKTKFQPKLKIDNNDLSLLCQNCHKCLPTPYTGSVLLSFKREKSSLFGKMSDSERLKWDKLYEELQKLDFYSSDCSKVMIRIKSRKIFKEDIKIFEMSYSLHQEVISIWKNIDKIDGKAQIDKYKIDIKKSLISLLLWLDPFTRRFGAKELSLFQRVKLKLNTSLDLLLYLKEISVADYALIHKQFFEILDNIESVDDTDNLSKKVDEIKNKLKNIKESSKKEEELVKRINGATDICQKFGS